MVTTENDNVVSRHFVFVLAGVFLLWATSDVEHEEEVGRAEGLGDDRVHRPGERNS